VLSNEIIGKKSGAYSLEYTWRDIILYALAVGAKEADLEYTFEKDLKALPTFGVVPCFSSLGVIPYMPKPADPSALAAGYLEDRAGRHMEHELIMYRPIRPMGGRLTYETEVVGLYDRGPGKGAVLQEQVNVYDEAGNPVCANNINLILLNGGGFGGAPLPRGSIQIPERAPDYELNDRLLPMQHLLYRLTGDTNNVHVDPEASRKEGVDRPFMHGLCSFGYVCRMAAGVLFPHQPEKMTRIAAQMRSILFPGSEIRLQLWINTEGSAYFRLINTETEVPILDRGIIEWAP
jgi:acyl dehydratase